MKITPIILSIIAVLPFQAAAAGWGFAVEAGGGRAGSAVDSAAPAEAAASHIGIAVARGGFVVDHAAVRGNSTVFEGSVVATPEVDSDIQLATGARIRLAAGSQGRVYSDRLVLEKGMGEVAGSPYRVEALGLKIRPASAARVSVVTPGRIQVAAIGGRVRVDTATGYEVASVLPGAPLEFSPQSGAAAPVAVAGKIEKKNGSYYLTDCLSTSVYQVVGENLDAQAGKLVQVKGTIDGSATPAAGASQVLRAASIEAAAPDVCAAAAPAGHKKLIAGVIVASAATTGTAIAVTRGKGKAKGKDISR
jgi:hypothetical protein